jgi:hypothetical protein
MGHAYMNMRVVHESACVCVLSAAAAGVLPPPGFLADSAKNERPAEKPRDGRAAHLFPQASSRCLLGQNDQNHLITSI